MWHLNVLKEQEAIVHSVVAELWPDVADVDIRQRLMCFHVSDLNNERVRAVALAVNHELCHNSSVIGCFPKRANPPF